MIGEGFIPTEKEGVYDVVENIWKYLGIDCADWIVIMKDNNNYIGVVLYKII